MNDRQYYVREGPYLQELRKYVETLAIACESGLDGTARLKNACDEIERVLGLNGKGEKS